METILICVSISIILIHCINKCILWKCANKEFEDLSADEEYLKIMSQD